MKHKAGSLTVICGSMFSGKTEELIRLVRRAMHARKVVQVFKSSLETRCETTLIQTHDGISFHATPVPDTKSLERLLLANVQVVGIEEIQFFDHAIVSLCERLANRGIEVIAAGLDQDFRGLPFGFMPELLARADDVFKLHAICKVCGEEATRTQRLVNGRPAAWDEPTILIGAEESYEARCRHCHEVRKRPREMGNEALRPSHARQGESDPHANRNQTGNGRALKSPRLKHANGKNGAVATVVLPVSDHGTQLEMFPEDDSNADPQI